MSDPVWTMHYRRCAACNTIYPAPWPKVETRPGPRGMVIYTAKHYECPQCGGEGEPTEETTE